MKRTGKQTLLLLITGLATLFAADTLEGQDLQLSVSLSENRVFTGEQFTLEIQVNADRLSDIELPQLPEISGLRLISPSPSRSQSISIINGEASTVTRYQFTLLAREEGEYRIPPMTVTIDGEPHQTDPLSLEVVRYRAASPPSDQRRPDIFAEIELDNENPVVGQQLVASLVVYFREGVELTSYQPVAGWRTDGFWKEQLDNIRQPSAESVILGGVRYRKAALLRHALFPSRAGELTLSPFELHLGVRTQPRRNDPFGTVFRGLGSNQRRITVETEPITLDIQRPDPPDRGTSITAVGDFTIDRTVSIRQSYTGEPIDLTTTVTGSGNLPLIRRPDYSLPDSFERYSPQEETDLNRRGSTIEGTRTFTDRFVPRVAGRYTIPEEIIPVYNPTAGSYEFHTLPEIEIDVLRDPAATLAESEDGVELQLMTGLVRWHDSESQTLLGRFWVWAALLLPLLALAYAWKRRTFLNRLKEDHRFARSHHAWDQVEERLLDAEKASEGESPKEAYYMLHKAIADYISDRTGLPPAGLSDQELVDHVKSQTGDHALANRLKRMLSQYAGISYAPAADQKSITSDIEQCRQLLLKLRQLL